jgi:hypothetical protein
VAKEENLKCRIGFFMHIPFPPWDMVKIHPWKDFFLQGHQRLNIKLDVNLQSLFGLHVYSCTLDPPFGFMYEGAIGHPRYRRRLFVTT